jgi:methionyl-tRNA formyltransferase
MDNQFNITELPSNPKIVFFGTPDFSVPTLEGLIHGGYDILSVVTQPDRPKGRGRRLTPSPVKLVAEKNSLPILQPERLDNLFFGPASFAKT